MLIRLEQQKEQMILCPNMNNKIYSVTDVLGNTIAAETSMMYTLERLFYYHLHLYADYRDPSFLFPLFLEFLSYETAWTADWKFQFGQGASTFSLGEKEFDFTGFHSWDRAITRQMVLNLFEQTDRVDIKDSLAGLYMYLSENPFLYISFDGKEVAAWYQNNKRKSDSTSVIHEAGLNMSRYTEQKLEQLRETVARCWNTPWVLLFGQAEPNRDIKAMFIEATSRNRRTDRLYGFSLGHMVDQCRTDLELSRQYNRY